MSDEQLDAQKTITLDASGNGVALLSPPSFRTWTVTAVNVLTSQSSTQTPVPRCQVWLGGLGGRLIAQTWMGNGATASGGDFTVQPSQQLAIQWTGGVPGSTASVYLDGTQTMR